KGRAALTLDLGDLKNAASLPVSVHHASGLLLSRETVPLETSGKQGVSLDRSSYLPGETARVRAHGLRSGELSLTGLGRIESDIIRENGSVEFPVPDGFPAGDYPLAWEIHYPDGKITRGKTTITIDSDTVRIADASVRQAPDGNTLKAEAVLVIESARPLNAGIRLMFTGPDGAAVIAAERTIALQPGSQTISLPIMPKSGHAGIVALTASVSAILPQGPGLPAGPVTFAERRMLIDRGNAAVIGLTVDQPFFEKPSGTMVAAAYLYGTGKAALRLSLAGEKVLKERFELSGSRTIEVNLTNVKPGAQTLRAELDGADGTSFRELNVVNGTILPDLVPSIVVGDISGTEIDIGIGVKNDGKTASGPSRAVLSDGDPDRDGRIIQKVDVPALAPGQPHISITKLSVLKWTGVRTLYAVADARNAVAESNKRNNREQYPFIVPDLLVKIKTEKMEVLPGEPLAYTLSAVNLSALDRKQLMFSARIIGPGAASISSEDIPIDDLPSTKARTYSRTFTPSAPLAPGKYLILAQLTSGKDILANTLAEVIVPPVLDLAGSLEGTPESGVLCRPFTVHLRTRNTGNIPVSSGTLTIEVRAPGVDPPALVRRLPFSLEEQQSVIDRLDLPSGSYRVILKVSASNKEHNIMREFIIAERPLTVTGPLKIEATGAAFPRVLLWPGNMGGSPARAALENMLRLAFQQEGIYYKIAGGPEEFSELAMSGMFNVFVLLDVTDQLQDTRWLKDLVEEGQGMIISGSDETAKTSAGAFGFSFGEPISSSGAALVITEQSGLGFSGTIPVSGTVLLAKKKGALPLALTAD
ncbi:MAG TPA: CARDB domain-containing protein, partial [Nitrospirota bacterium]|nr:CARDB domain-containing protein [Nitrospirota bacterium]